MLVVPGNLKAGFAKFLTKKGLQENNINKCQKWLRFYLDFCHKYQHKPLTTGGLEAFLEKLAEKRQTDQMRREAERAVLLYNEYFRQQPGNREKEKVREIRVQQPKVESTQRVQIKSFSTHETSDLSPYQPARKSLGIGSSWEKEFQELVNSIRIRHYSDKTLRSYRKYVRDFQAHTQSQSSSKPIMLKTFSPIWLLRRRCLHQPRILHLVLCFSFTGMS